jgi:hypothetical protein
MFISIDETDRALALKAIELTEKKIDSARTHLAELALPQMEAQRLGAFVARVKKDLHNTERDGFDWSGDLREALRVCVSIYREKLESLREAQVKLIVPVDDTTDKLTQLRFLGDKIHGQERLPLDDIAVSINGGPEFPASNLTRAAEALREGR